MTANDVKELRELLGLTQDELANKIGVTRNTIINYEKGGVIPASKEKLLLALEELATINVDAKNISIDQNNNVSAIDSNGIEFTTKLLPTSSKNKIFHKKHGIPHIEAIEAYCGKGKGFEVSVMTKDCPMYNIPGVENADFTIRAKGQSMINKQNPSRSIKEGDYIACKKPKTNIIRYGEIYALATSDGVMVKVVQPCEEEGYVILESFNIEEGYRPFKFPVVDIHDMALVVAVASVNVLA